MKRVSVLTSGGDAPGMNAALRAVVRAGIDKGWSMFGVRCGYTGLISGEFMPLGLRDVGGIIQQGGTILGSSRCEEFKTKAGRAKALLALERQAIDALIVIGGDGSQAGAYHLSETGYPVVGIASTIDNDLYGSEISIGVDTALNVALEAIDRLKVTASSHGRAFLIEVMGRNCGYLALVAGITGGAEVIVIPEVEVSPDQIACEFRQGYERGKRHAIAVVSEGAHYDGQRLLDYFREHEERLGFELRLTKLGHVQRGGAPGAFDRLLATRFGVAAVQELSAGLDGVMVGLIKDEVCATPFSDIINNKKQLDLGLLDTARMLAR
jgi:6-phosphofructokinase 1